MSSHLSPDASPFGRSWADCGVENLDAAVGTSGGTSDELDARAKGHHSRVGNAALLPTTRT